MASTGTMLCLHKILTENKKLTLFVKIMVGVNINKKTENVSIKLTEKIYFKNQKPIWKSN